MVFPTSSDPTFNWGSESFSFQDLLTVKVSTMDSSAVVIATITPDATGSIPLKNPFTGNASPTRGVVVDVAGLVTGHDAFGNPITNFPLAAGVNWVSLAGVTSVTTIAHIAGVW
jgi:hypothetical protein